MIPFFTQNPGNVELRIQVRDIETQMHTNLISKTLKISVGKELIRYLKDNPALEFSIN